MDLRSPEWISLRNFRYRCGNKSFLKLNSQRPPVRQNPFRHEVLSNWNDVFHKHNEFHSSLHPRDRLRATGIPASERMKLPTRWPTQCRGRSADDRYWSDDGRFFFVSMRSQGCRSAPSPNRRRGVLHTLHHHDHRRVLRDLQTPKSDASQTRSITRVSFRSTFRRFSIFEASSYSL